VAHLKTRCRDLAVGAVEEVAAMVRHLNQCPVVGAVEAIEHPMND
jgi:hypothetical protein